MKQIFYKPSIYVKYTLKFSNILLASKQCIVSNIKTTKIFTPQINQLFIRQIQAFKALKSFNNKFITFGSYVKSQILDRVLVYQHSRF